MSAELAREVKSIHKLLSPKPILNNDRIFDCIVTHVEDLSEFYVRANVDGAPCLCSVTNSRIRDLEMRHKALQDAKLGNPAKAAEDAMDNYHFGYSAMEMPEGLGCESTGSQKIDITTSTADNEKALNAYLNRGFAYKKLHSLSYVEGLEMVAVRMNGKWMRGVALKTKEDRNFMPTKIRVQLLETGEKLWALPRNVCRLPEAYARPAAGVIFFIVLILT